MIDKKAEYVCRHQEHITQTDLEQLPDHRAFSIWFTGLS